MLPKKNSIKIEASSDVFHPELKKNPWTLNRRKDFIFHTKKEDPKPEVVIRFLEDSISTEDVVYLYNRGGASIIEERLRGVQLSISEDGMLWELINIDIADNNVYDGVPIKVDMRGKKYLKIFRHNPGPPIHLSQITIGMAFHEKEKFDADLTRALAKKYKLLINKKGRIVENEKRKLYMSVKSSYYDTKNVVGLSSISALKIMGLGRFSNALMQLCNALIIANKLSVKKIYLPNGETARRMFRSSFPVICRDLGITICIPDCDEGITRETVLSGRFFYVEEHPHLVEGGLSAIEATSLFKHGLGFYYGPRNAIEEDELVIHIRSGDIFSNNTPHPGYGQPPLAYYIKIIDMMAPRVVHIVFEDEGNPVIGALKALLSKREIPMVLQSSSLRDDIQKILNAKSLVAGRGTFVSGIVLLSENIKTVYSFQVKITVPKNGKNVVIDDVVGEFSERVLKHNWVNSEEQRNLMLHYPVSALAMRQEPTSEIGALNSEGVFAKSQVH